MRPNLKILAIVLITAISCNNSQVKKFTFVHSLKTKTDDPIGNVYVKFLSDSVFTDLFIINSNDTLFTIRKTVLSSKNGKEAEVNKNGFLGYAFILKKDDYIVLTNLGENGQVSDDITIEWNYDSKILELLKVP